jgi:hypothetical protein
VRLLNQKESRALPNGISADLLERITAAELKAIGEEAERLHENLDRAKRALIGRWKSVADLHYPYTIDIRLEENGGEKTLKLKTCGNSNKECLANTNRNDPAWVSLLPVYGVISSYTNSAKVPLGFCLIPKGKDQSCAQGLLMDMENPQLKIKIVENANSHRGSSAMGLIEKVGGYLMIKSPR